MLGARIAVLRQNAGLSQSALAAKLMISPSTVGMYEQGRREPSVDTLVAMAEFFGVSVEYLITGKTGEIQELQTVQSAVTRRVRCVEARWERRRMRPFSRRELTVLLAAVLMDAQ